jgi:hypothetical protein
MSWYETPYKGGPMVAVPGFPRELDVGDQDGPDVIAVSGARLPETSACSHGASQLSGARDSRRNGCDRDA